MAAAKLLQSCPTLCNPIDGSPPGYPVRGIFQARELEWGAIAFSYYTLMGVKMWVYEKEHERQEKREKHRNSGEITPQSPS